MNIKQLKNILQEELASAPIAIKGDCSPLSFGVSNNQLVIRKDLDNGHFYVVDTLLQKLDEYQDDLEMAFNLTNEDDCSEIKLVTGAIYMADPTCIGIDY